MTDMIETVEAIDEARQELENIRACYILRLDGDRIEGPDTEALVVMSEKVSRALALLEGAVFVGTIDMEREVNS